MKEYLIAFKTDDGDILCKTYFAASQKDAIYTFGLDWANCDILAITLIEG